MRFSQGSRHLCVEMTHLAFFFGCSTLTSKWAVVKRCEGLIQDALLHAASKKGTGCTGLVMQEFESPSFGNWALHLFDKVEIKSSFRNHIPFLRGRPSVEA